MSNVPIPNLVPNRFYSHFLIIKEQSLCHKFKNIETINNHRLTIY